MTKVDIISGFLGAGKTTLIKKLLSEALAGEKIVLIENEFGEIGIDGGFLKEAGIQVSEMNSGCICCSLVGDFGQALEQVLEQYQPDRILIEPSGVGKLSDVMAAVRDVADRTEGLVLNSAVTVADASKVKVYMKNFGEFYNNQVESAGTIILSRTQKLTEDKLAAAAALLREKNPEAALVTTPWDQLEGKRLLEAMEGARSLARQLMEEAACPVCGGHHIHEHHHHDEPCDCHDHDDHHHEHDGHHHDDWCHHHDHCHESGHEGCAHGHEHGHHHEHHHHDESCGCGHDHDHHHDDHCGCGHDHHHHHADEVFDSWGAESPKTFRKEELSRILEELDAGACGTVLRAKGIVPAGEEGWLQFDYVPGEWEVRSGGADYTGRLCVIGAELDEKALKRLFGV